MSSAEPTDLLCRARREALSADEQRRLDELLATSAEARLVRGMLTELDRESRVRAGDDLLLARISAHVVAERRFSRPVRRRSRAPLVLIAAALLLVVSVASAWILTTSSRARSALGTPASAGAKSPAPRAKAPPSRVLLAPPPAPTTTEDIPQEEPVEAPVEAAPAAPSADPSAGQAAQTRVRRTPASPSVGKSPVELFAEANRLRREGHAREAMDLYERVVRESPAAREAAPARLALAKLLRTSDPQRALLQFRALAAQGGALRAEGLWGVAETSMQLGSTALEAQALSNLVSEFPNSPYADAARSRIANGSP